MVLGYDIDGCVARTGKHIFDSLQKANIIDTMFSYETMIGDEITWDPIKRTGIPGVKEEHLIELFTHPEFWLSIPPYRGVIESINGLPLIHKYAITDRSWYAELYLDTMKWLNINKCEFDSLHICKGKLKGKYAEQLGVTHFIEDRLKNCIHISPYVEKVYLLDRGHYSKEELSSLPSNIQVVKEHQLIEELRVLSYLYSPNNALV